MNDGIIIGSKIPLESHGRVNNNSSWEDMFFNFFCLIAIIQFSVRFPKINLSENAQIL